MHPIEKICQEYNLTRYQLAGKAKLNTSTVNAWVETKADMLNIKLKTAIALSNALGISLDDLAEKIKDYVS